MKNVKYIVVHCTETPPTATIEELKRLPEKETGWSLRNTNHFIVARNGETKWLFKYRKYSDCMLNKDCIHIAYIGGIDKEGKPVDNRTQRQEDALFDKLVELSTRYPQAEIVGYRDLPGIESTSPCFDVKKWVANYEPDFLELEYETELAA
jgi:N-acetylmuramoyl-L-alanine amidase